ncbi:MAG: type III pantothenate kinase [bacterium]
MIICVDLGNTTTALAVLDGLKVKRFWRVMTTERTSDEYSVLVGSLLDRAGLGKSKITFAGICSVVPSETKPIADALAGGLGLKVGVMEPGRDCGVAVLTESPAEVGADRIANAVGAFYEYGGPAIVVDIGTATTFDVVSAGGEYLGGAIAPGMLAGARDLWTRARMLPAVEIKAPADVIGRTTTKAMQSGIFYGTAGQIEGVVRRMWGAIGGRCEVIMTGGFAGLVCEHLAFKAVFDPALTLKGVAYALDKSLRSRRRKVVGRRRPATRR